MQKTKRPLSFLLAVLMIVSMFAAAPFSALAVPEGTPLTDQLPSTQGTYYLTQDITISSTWLAPSGATTLDLNGYGIRMTGTGTVIDVCRDASCVLTLNDSRPTYSGGENRPSGILGGYITGGTGSKDHPGTSTATYILGGGIYVNNAVLNINGGTITGNSAAWGGGIYIYNDCTVNMTGGAITGNSCARGGYGGGVFLSATSTFNVSHTPSITGNYSSYSGNKVTKNVHMQVVYSGGKPLYAVITIVSPGLTAGAQIGIYEYQTNAYPVTSGYSTYHSGVDPGTYFSCDNAGWAYKVNSEGELLSVPAFTITWLNEDGSLIDTTTVAGGTVPTHADATKDATAQYTYTFAGWSDGTTTYAPDDALPEVIRNATYTATFTQTDREYTITWKNDDNTLIDTTNVAYGMVPTHDDPVKEADEYIYTFAGWSPEVTAVTGDAIYTATYTSEVNPAYVPPHTHDFTYAANEATLTATCRNADCGLTDSAVSFTINAPAKTRYSDGKSAAATLTGVDAFNEATGKTVSADDIKYYKGDQQLDAAPVNAGTYQARITVEGATAVVEYTIAKMNPVVIVPGTRNATYGDTLDDVTLPAGWSWKDDLTTSVGNAGVKTFTAVYTPDDPENYNTKEAAVTVNVAKANPDYQIPADLTATVGDTLADVTLPDGWAWQDSTEPVGAVGEKRFKATFTPADIENYNIVENIDVPVTVGKALPVYETPTGLTATYGDTLADVTLPDDENGTWTWKDDNTTSVGNAGENSFIAVFTPTDIDNYAVVEVPVTITVGKATPSFDAPAGLTATEGDTLADVTLPEGWSWKDSGTSVGEAGEKTFKATFTPADTANYNVVENIDVTVTVSAKTPDAPDTPDTPDTPDKGDFRCGFCDEYEYWKDTIVIGWFVSLIHIFVHLAAHIGHIT